MKFKRHAYTKIGDKDEYKTLIHYIGDHTSVIAVSHGNTKAQ